MVGASVKPRPLFIIRLTKPLAGSMRMKKKEKNSYSFKGFVILALAKTTF